MLPRAGILAWRADHAPWADEDDVAQDLLLTRTLCDVFAAGFLRERLAFRGGTALHQLHLPPVARYSDDLDFVQREAEPIGPMLDRLRPVLGWLGRRRSEIGEHARLPAPRPSEDSPAPGRRAGAPPPPSQTGPPAPVQPADRLSPSSDAARILPVMHTWSDLEGAAPDMAATARRLFWIPGMGLGYLATVGADGAPRIHPINIAIVGGRLVTFLVPSPKRADLERDGRYALHAPGSETENDEVMIRGRAIPRDDDPAFRLAAVAAMTFAVPPEHALFELSIDVVLWAAYPTPVAFPPAYHRWPPRS